MSGFGYVASLNKRFSIAALVVAMALFIFPVQALADEQDMAALLSILEAETEIATKTKMNADYVPGILTVLMGDDLEALGVRTVWEALGMVPGVFNTIANEGIYQTVIRGVGFSAFYGNMKFMVDSIPVNLSFDSTAPAIMLLPVEMVERIDVIRGPGTALYGEFSYAGVINIITRRGENRFYAHGGSFTTYGGGLIYNHKSEDGIAFDLNLTGWDSDGADVNSGPDGFASEAHNADKSFAPGPTHEDEETRSLSMAVSHERFNVQLFGAERRRGDYFGMRALKPASDDKTIEENEYFVKAAAPVDIGPSLKGEIGLLYFTGNSRVRNHLIAPPGVGPPSPPGGDPPGGGPPGGGSSSAPRAGKWIGNYTEEARTEVSADLYWNPNPDHELLLRLSAASIEILDAWSESNENPVTNDNFDSIIRLPAHQDAWIDTGKKRRILSAAVQDQISISDDLTLTAALRFDDYDDVGSAITPRLSAVWRISEPHILKAQYAQAFRPPTFSELYTPQQGPGRLGNPELEPETAATYELGYIYRDSEMTGRATVYYATLTNLIGTFVEPGEDLRSTSSRTPQNAGERTLKGVELEFDRRLSDSWTLLGSVSYMETDSSGGHINGSTDLLANVALKGRLTNDLLATARFHSVGTRFRGSIESRDDLGGYSMVDLTMTWLNAFMDGLTVRAGLKNALDTDYKASSLGQNTYLYDLPRAGRTWWAQVSYRPN